MPYLAPPELAQRGEWEAADASKPTLPPIDLKRVMWFILLRAGRGGLRHVKPLMADTMRLAPDGPPRTTSRSWRTSRAIQITKRGGGNAMCKTPSLRGAPCA